MQPATLRTSTIPAILILAAAASTPRAAAAEESAEAAARRPNIIFLLTDDQRWDALGCMGNPIIETPHIDRLAQEGVVFDHCFVTTSICMTNRASIFSGQYAARHGIIDFRTEFTPPQLAETYPALLKDAGYYLGFIGKWGVGHPPEGLFDFDTGWPGQHHFFPERNDPTRHLTAIMGEEAIEFLEGAPDDRPFCLSISFKAPHVQDGDPANFPQWIQDLYEEFPGGFLYDPALEPLYRDVVIPPVPLMEPEHFAALPDFLQATENRRRWKWRFATPEMYQRSVKAYYRLITGVDLVVGRIVEALREQELLEDTVILFHSDNGFYLGERGFAGKWFGHEESIRVPLVVFDPSLPERQRGTRRQQFALSIDIAPTILEMAGAVIPEGVQGRSLVPVLAESSHSWREEFFYEHLFEHPAIPRSEGVRTQRHKYLRYLDSDPLYEELYDLEKDPHEANNLAGQPAHEALLETMRDSWSRWRERAR